MSTSHLKAGQNCFDCASGQLAATPLQNWVTGNENTFIELTPSVLGTRSPNHFQESCNKFMANGLNCSLTVCVIKRLNS